MPAPVVLFYGVMVTIQLVSALPSWVLTVTSTCLAAITFLAFSFPLESMVA